MLITINKSTGKIETGFLRAINKEQLKNYRDSLLKPTNYNFTIYYDFIEKEYKHLDANTK